MNIAIKTLAPAGPSMNEAFHERVLHCLAGRDVVPANSGILAPSQYCMRRHFRSVVRDDHIGLAAQTDQVIQFTRHPRAGQRSIHGSYQCLTGAVIYNEQHAELLPVFESVGDKIQ